MPFLCHIGAALIGPPPALLSAKVSHKHPDHRPTPSSSLSPLRAFSPKCPTSTPLTSSIEGFFVLHTIISGVCPTTTRVLTYSRADECGTLWRREQKNRGNHWNIPLKPPSLQKIEVPGRLFADTRSDINEHTNLIQDGKQIQFLSHVRQRRRFAEFHYFA